ncbi:hypothetical protein [Microlunatus flavus]|nr:hypothetical protein [Microlunatus flavus]
MKTAPVGRRALLAWRTCERDPMADAAFVLLTVAVFAALALLVRGGARL